MTIKNKPTASEILEILNQPWIGTEEIKRLACVGNDKARKIKTKIKEQLLDEGYTLPSSNVANIDFSMLFISLGGMSFPVNNHSEVQ